MSMNSGSSSEPDASKISPLLGTNRLQSAVDRMTAGADKVATGLQAAATTIQRLSTATRSTLGSGGFGSGATLSGGKPNGNAGPINIGPRLGAPTQMGMPSHQNLPTFTQTYGLPQGKPRGNGGWAWGAAGTAAGMWATSALQSSAVHASTATATNTTAQLLSRGSGREWTDNRTTIMRDNFTAKSDGDTMLGALNLRRSGFSLGSSGYNSLLGAAKNYRVLDPTATFEQATARMTSTQSVGTSNFLLSRGIRTLDAKGNMRDQNAVVNDILNKAGFSGDHKYSKEAIDKHWSATGNATMLMQELAKTDPNLAAAAADQLRGSMTAQSKGFTRDQFQKAWSKGDWDALEPMDIKKTDIDATADVEAKSRNIRDTTAKGFSEGLQNTTASLEQFKGALDAIMHGPLGDVVGHSSGMINGVRGVGGSAGGYGGAAVGGGVGGGVAGVGGASTDGVMPVGDAKVTAGFGHYPKSGKPHYGVDYGVPVGTPVRAARGGKVYQAGWDKDGFGNHVRIDSGDGLYHIYGHLSKVLVRSGSTVKTGQIIGYSGSSGNSTGPHLHYEVRKGGKGRGAAVNPNGYLGAHAASGADAGHAGHASGASESGHSMAAQAGSSLGMPWGVSEGSIIAAALSGAAAGPATTSRGTSTDGDSAHGEVGATPTGPLSGLLSKAGFRGNGLSLAYAIMMAESRGNARAHNTNRRTGDNSYGLFQINMLGGMGPERRAKYNLSNNDALFDPATNARVAYAMSKGGTDWSPWSTYKSGTYKKYLGGQAKSYDVGSTNIDVDQMARVHKGEMIIDPVTADEIRKALSTNSPTSALGSGKGGRGIHIDQITIQTAHPYTDSAATDLAKQFLAIVGNHDQLQTIQEG